MDAVIYARQSLDRDGEGLAVSRQLEQCRQLAVQLGLQVEREFVDNDVSATRGERPEFQTMMGFVRAGRISTILVWDADRLYRRLRDLVEIVETAEKHSLTIATVRSGDLDLTNPSGRMLAGLLGSVARYEIEQKSARQIAANAQRAANGKYHFAQRPFGYRRRGDGEIEIVEEEAGILREAIARYVAGESWYGIAKTLKERGVASFNGKPFSMQNLRQRAINPALAGIRTYRGEVVTEQGDWPAIIEPQQWSRFQTQLQMRGRSQAWSKKIKYLLSGIAICGRCGATLIVARDWSSRNAKTQDHPPVYQCRNNDLRRLLAPVDELVEDAVIHRLSQPDALALMTPTRDLTHLAEQSRDLRDRIEGLAELYAEGTLTAAAVRSQRAKLDEQLSELQTRISAMHSGEVLNALLSSRSIRQYWDDSMPIRAKRAVVDSLLTVTILPVGRGGNHEFDASKVRLDWKSA